MNMQLMRDRMVQPQRARVWPGKRNRITKAAVSTGTMTIDTALVVRSTRSSRSSGSMTGVSTALPSARRPSLYKSFLRLPAPVEGDELVLHRRLKRLGLDPAQHVQGPPHLGQV